MKQQFTIYRDRWLRGPDYADPKTRSFCGMSYLHRPYDGKECCVGQYLRHLGVPVESLSGVRWATDISPLPEAAEWLRHAPTLQREERSSDLAVTLYRANDEENIPDPIREKIITTLFAEAGVAVEFADHAPRS